MLPSTWYPCVPFVFQGVSNFCSDTLFKLQNITLVIKGVYYCGATRAIASTITLATHLRTCLPRSRFPVSVIIDDLYFKISWRVSTSLKARQFGRIQWDSLKNKNRWNIHIQTTPLNSQARQRRGRRDWNISLSRGTQRRFPPKCIENTFSLIQSTFKSLEMHSQRRYKIVSVRSS